MSAAHPPLAPARKVSIRTVLLSLLIGEIVVLVGVTWWLWYSNGQKAIHEVEGRLRSEIAARIQQHLDRFLAEPDRVNQINEDAYRSGQLDLSDVEALEPHLWRQMQVFDTVSYIDIGTETGQFLGIERLRDGSLALEMCTPSTGGALFTYPLSADGTRLSKKIRPDYEVRTRPWYLAALRTPKPTWSEIYPFFSLPVRLGITAVRSVNDPEGNIVGVLGCDLVLSNLDKYLESLDLGQTGRTFILERDGLLVASSSGEPSAVPVGDERKRIQATELRDPLIAGAAQHLAGLPGGFARIRRPEQVAFHLDGQRVLLDVMPIQDALGLDWLAVIAIPEAEFLGAVEENTRTTLLLFGILLLVAGFTVFLTTRRISRSILDVSDEMKRLASFEVADGELVTSPLREIHAMQASLKTMRTALRSFGKYVPVDVVRQLVHQRQEADLGLRPADVTIYFSDVADFTSISENLAPDTLVEIMSEYLDEMSQIIIKSGGTVDKYRGDSIMAFWNAPEPIDDHPLRAVEATLACQKRLEELKDRWESVGLPRLVARTGLHTGPVLVGNFGSRRRMDYTVIGDAVNLASRLEGLNKLYGTDALITDGVWRAVRETHVCRLVDVVSVKGKSLPTRVYELVGAAAEVTVDERHRITMYEEALGLYMSRLFRHAAARFGAYLERWPDDRAAHALRTRCLHYAESPPPTDWRWAHSLEVK